MSKFTVRIECPWWGWLVVLSVRGLVPQGSLAQTAPTATWQWANRAASTATSPEDYSEGHYLRLDNAGNVFSAGTFRGAMTLGTAILQSPGGYNSFLAKYTPTGTLAWLQHLDSSFQETIIKGIAVDANGNCYVAGYYAPGGGVLVLGPFILTGGGGFLAKYDPQGVVLWARGVGQGFDGLACSAAGEVVAMGVFEGSVVLGNTTLTSPNLSSGFVVQYDPQGQVRWAQKIEGVSNDEAVVGLDATGNAYVAAAFRGLATVGPYTLTGSTNDDDVLVARYSATGTPQWAVRQPGGSLGSEENVWAMATDAGGNAYLLSVSEAATGLDRQWHITQYTPQGTVGWNHASTPTQASGLMGLVTDTAGNVYASGVVAGSLSIGGLSLASSASTEGDLALVSFTGQGAPRWALRAGTPTGTETALALALDNSNQLYVTGTLQGSTSLGMLSLPQNSISDEHFVAKAALSSVMAFPTAQRPEIFTLYPNPVHAATVHVRWATTSTVTSQVRVYDALGRCVLTHLVKAGHREALLPIQTLAPGLYRIHLETAAHVITSRLMIE